MITIIFGLPRSGKTTYAAKIVADNLRKGIKTYSNVNIIGSVPFQISDFDTNRPFSDGEMIIDEASLEFNSRHIKSFSKGALEFFKKYGHKKITKIWIFSQAPDDMDLTIRRLSENAYYLRKSIFGLSTLKKLVLRFAVDPEKHEPTIFWDWARALPKFFWRPKYYKMFDTHEGYEKAPDNEPRYGLSLSTSNLQNYKASLRGQSSHIGVVASWLGWLKKK